MTVSIACANCGAPLKVPETVRFVTCFFCDSQLRVETSEGATWTEIREDLAVVKKAVMETQEAVGKAAAMSERAMQETRLMRLIADYRSAKEDIQKAVKVWVERSLAHGQLSRPLETAREISLAVPALVFFFVAFVFSIVKNYEGWVGAVVCGVGTTAIGGLQIALLQRRIDALLRDLFEVFDLNLLLARQGEEKAHKDLQGQWERKKALGGELASQRQAMGDTASPLEDDGEEDLDRVKMDALRAAMVDRSTQAKS